MSVWKQIIVGIVVLAVAGAAWVRFFPGAGEILSRWGIDWAVAATGEQGGPQGGKQSDGSRRGSQSAGQAPTVIAAPATHATINDKLSAIGTGRARNSVIVNPYASGRLTEIAVTAGSVVARGDVLARLDAETEEIAVDRARIALDDAKARLERITALRSSNTATTVQLNDAELVVRNAELALRDSELALSRRTIVAPIAGIVGILPVETGNYVTSQTAIATIDDRSTIVIDFWVPERYASAIAVGAPLEASPISRPGEIFKGSVSAVDNRLDEASRTLRVQAGIPNDQDSLRAGMSFQVTMRFPGDTYPSVNPLAVQWGTDGAFIWVVRDGKAERTPVKIIQRNTESVLVDASVAEGDLVVTEGVQSVRDGAAVQIAGGQPELPRKAENDVPAAGGGS